AGLVREGSSEEGSSDPRRSTYGRGYWLRRCEGFVVETPTRRIGRVAGIRYGERSNEPAVLEVRTGMFGRKVLLITVDTLPRSPPRPAGSSCGSSSSLARARASNGLKRRSPLTDSNRRPPPYHGGALPTELRGQRAPL